MRAPDPIAATFALLNQRERELEGELAKVRRARGVLESLGAPPKPRGRPKASGGGVPKAVPASPARRVPNVTPAAASTKARVQRCGICREVGHRRETCAKRDGAGAAAVDDSEDDEDEGEMEQETQGVILELPLSRGSRTRVPRAGTRAKVLAGRALRDIVSLPVVLSEAELAARPRTRGDCAGGPRPCPWVSCRHHLYLDVQKHEESDAPDSLKLNFPDREPEDLLHTCALDVAAHGGASLDQVGQLMNITREGIRQIEVKALAAMRAGAAAILPTEEGGIV